MTSFANLSSEAMSALVDASAAINAAQGIDATFAAIARAAAAVLKAEASSVIILDPVRRKQVFRAAVGDRADQLLGLDFDQGLGLSGKAMATCQALRINDVAAEKAHYKDIDSRLAFRTRSLLAVPLVHRDRTLGVVEILNPVQAETFTDDDLQLAKVFANLAAIAAGNAQSYERLQRENRSLRQDLPGAEEMIGDGAAMLQVRELIDRVAPTATTVLLLGETGTGKELAARSLHARSDRAGRAFVAVNCAALPETLLESELFGHEAGAFTGAVARRLGRFELADGGTIFLDEIGEIAPSIQVKLLRAIQEKEIVRVGGTRTVGCDVRIIAATHRDLETEMQAGQFREDLYYRLNVFPITIPPLRQRMEDLPALTRHIVRRLTAEMKMPIPAISPEALVCLGQYEYPGNIRQLQNILERACLLCGKPNDLHGEPCTIRPEHLPPELTGKSNLPAIGTSTLAAHERTMILNALQAHDWNQTRAAEALGISRDNIRYRMKKYGIQRAPRTGPPQAGLSG